jgi:CheY-like chemotaxis protein
MRESDTRQHDVVRGYSVVPASDLPRTRVLIVDDQDESRRLCASYCDLFDHTSDTARSGTEALEALRRRRFDLALVNVHMMGANDLDLVSALRMLAKPRLRLPLIGLVSRTHADEAQRWLAAGLAAVVTKPVTAARLFAAIRSVLEPPEAGSRTWAPAGRG